MTAATHSAPALTEVSAVAAPPAIMAAFGPEDKTPRAASAGDELALFAMECLMRDAATPQVKQVSFDVALPDARSTSTSIATSDCSDDVEPFFECESTGCVTTELGYSAKPDRHPVFFRAPLKRLPSLGRIGRILSHEKLGARAASSRREGSTASEGARDAETIGGVATETQQAEETRGPSLPLPAGARARLNEGSMSRALPAFIRLPSLNRLPSLGRIGRQPSRG